MTFAKFDDPALRILKYPFFGQQSANTAESQQPAEESAPD